MADLSATIDALVRPLADQAEVDLVDVVVVGEGARTRVRVVVDRKGGVDVGTCQRIAKALGRTLDEADPVAQRYTLEVTSPGTDRQLDDQRSFDRIEGRAVKVLLRGEDGEPEDRRTLRGVVTAAGPEVVELTDGDGTVHAVPYRDIHKATQELPW
ncbi:MAG TPA: hypothetical protein VMM13_00450 [Euzebya sp.]|nr:hypothetical protein [Euzebya sp.]